MQVLVFGCGNLAKQLIANILADGNKVVFLDKHDECLSYFATTSSVEIIRVNGSNLMEELSRGDVDTSDMVVAVSQDDNTNAMVAQIASHIFNIPRVVCHIGDVNRRETYRRIGLNIVCSTEVIADAIIRALEGEVSR